MRNLWLNSLIRFSAGILFCWLLAANGSSLVLADSSKFSTSFELVYRIASDGMATANYNYRLTNLTSEYLPSEYVAQINSGEIYSVKAFDRNGPLAIEILESSEGKTKVKIKFRPEASGIGKTYVWTFSYETAAVAKRAGAKWQVNIPRPSDAGTVADFSIWVFVPDSFGSLLIAKPKSNFLGNVWTKNDVPAGGIRLFYGQESSNLWQNYNFRLRYRLSNKKLYPVTQEIVVPSDSSYQRVALNLLTPRPVNVRVDQDGNWVAKYQLGALSQLDIVASGSATVFQKPQYKETNFVLADFLKPRRFWDVDDSRIAELARELKTPEAIYSFVSKLKIDDQSPVKNGRSGGAKVLALKKGSNLFDYSDLFISLARAAGIASRQVFGYSPESGLSVWVEYYDKDRLEWIMADPAQGSSSGWDFFSEFDVNHIAFAVRGNSSELPIPAGAYGDLNDGQDVEVSFGDKGDLVFPPARYAVRANIDEKLVAGFEVSTNVYVDNFGPTVLDFTKIEVVASRLSVSQETIRGLSVIPPFGSLEVPIKIYSTAFNEYFSDIISVRFKETDRSYKVLVEPIYQSPVVIVLALIFCFGFLSIVTQIARSVSLQKQKGRNGLRRKSKIA